MAVKIEDLAEYEVEHDKYVGALTTAKAAGDELAEMKAELAWRESKDKLRDTAETRSEQQRVLTATLEQVKKDYPDVPEVFYKKLTDPEEILEIAKAGQEQIDTIKKQRAPRGQAWSTPAAGSAPTGGGKQDKYNDPDYLNDLNKRFNRKGTRDGNEAAQEVFGEIFERQVMPNFQRAIERGQQPNQ
jgi:DNA-binding protein H-NS